MTAEKDWQVDETETPGEEEADSPLRYEILNYPADTTLSGYLELWDKGQLRVPEFQRGYVWDQVRASKLVESFLLGLPVPGVFLFKEKNSPQYLIVDGQQRIKTIVDFQKGLFEERLFRLKNVLPQWEGKLFSELSSDEQFKLQGAVLRATIIQQINPDDHSSIYHIFERLNTGGVNLNPMEIRQCISYGPFVGLLKKMNADSSWRRLLGQRKVDKRLRDTELVLRVLALANAAATYEKPMKSFLNAYMESQRNHDARFDQIERKFRQVVKFTAEELPAKPFHLRGRLNYGVLDSVLATLLSANALPDNFEARFNNLINDEQYLPLVTSNTSDASVLRERLEIADRHLLRGQ